MACLRTSSPLPSCTAYFYQPSRFSRRACIWCCFTRKLYIFREEERRKAGPVMPSNLDSLQKRRSSPCRECRSREVGSSGTEAEAANFHNEPGGYGDKLLEAEKNLLTLPTTLTLGRVAAIPILIIVFYLSQRWANMAVAGIFVFAAITDWLDGYLARKMGTHSSFGAFLDPVADKLMVATTLVLLSTKPFQVSWAQSLPWLISVPSVAIIGREITMSAVREWAASQGGDILAAVAVNKLGKWKTASQMVALTILLAVRNDCVNGIDSALLSVGVISLYASAALALWSLAVYVKGIWGALTK